MDVILLGTGNPIPDARRAGPATLVRAGSTLLLVDAGRGVLQRLVAVGVLPMMLDALLVTHLHSDHLTDLNDVITTNWAMSPVPRTLRVYGPPGLRAVVDATLAALAPDIGYRLAHHDDLQAPPDVAVTEVAPGEALAFGEVTVRVGATDHRPVEPTVGYRVEHGGGAAVLAGDTIPFAGLDALCAGAQVYVQTVVRDDLVQRVPSARFQDVIDYHSTVAQAAATAARAGVRTLVLTHMVPAPAPGTEAEWAALARDGFAGEVLVGEDLMTIPV